jgi:hypothetical protein
MTLPVLLILAGPGFGLALSVGLSLCAVVARLSFRR